MVALNLALQGEDSAACTDAELAEHIRRAIAHFAEVAPLHFEHSGFDLAVGLLLRACAEWGIDAADVTALLAGSSPATAAVADHIEQIVRRLDAVPESLDDVRDAGEGAYQWLDSLLTQHAWRVIDGNDLAGPTLGERPDFVLAAIRTRMEVGPRRVEFDIDAVRARVPAAERDRFTELLADARGLYSLRDDDNGICFVWPLGLIRRGVLEAGRRLAGRGALRDPDDLFDATPDEIDALLAGSGPSADELASRHDARRSARGLEPPMQLGDFEPEQALDELPSHTTELVGDSPGILHREPADRVEQARCMGSASEPRWRPAPLVAWSTTTSSTASSPVTC